MKICLIVLDGWGHNLKPKQKDAIQDANCKNMRFLSKKYLSYLIHASGKYVGLHEGCMGNSEVGHLTIGSGRVVKQNIILIDEAFSSGSIKENLRSLIALNKKRLHLIGLVSDGGIHSHVNHLIGLINTLSKNFEEIFVHCISDGRDTAPYAFTEYLDCILTNCLDSQNYSIASVGGRFYAMDRDNNEDRINKYFNTLTSEKEFDNIKNYIKDQYNKGYNDENIVPALFSTKGRIQKDDLILFFNFRADRMRQITKKFINEKYNLFTFTEYEKGLTQNVIFKPSKVINTLSDILEKNGIEQVHIAETEKYAHVTYFFNGGTEKKHKFEDRKIVESKKVKSFAENPKMSSENIANEVITSITENKQFIVANFAAPDMVGHTGDYNATVKAVECVDDQIGKIYNQCLLHNYVLIITADHGNAEIMFDEIQNLVSKKHTSNKVPFIVTIPKERTKNNTDWDYENSKYSLADVAPTILSLFGIEPPQEFTGKPIV